MTKQQAWFRFAYHTLIMIVVLVAGFPTAPFGHDAMTVALCVSVVNLPPLILAANDVAGTQKPPTNSQR